MMNLMKAITAIMFAATLLWSTTAIAHPPDASAPSHHHQSPSAGACAYACALLGHGDSTYDDCGQCSCGG